MEFVAGSTLRAWAAERTRTWRQLLSVLIDVARGVAAAHVADLVHRDLKPDNVMISDDDRVRVMDFGLAYGQAFNPEPQVSVSLNETGIRPELAAFAAKLTQAGGILGTPPYMAPEQWEGKNVGGAADQFSWSVMAWEILYGERPFVGESPLGLAVEIMSGRRRPPPKRRRVPRWLRRIVERGLAVEPSQRWPTMEALLSALTRGAIVARLRVAALLTVCLVMLASGLLAYRKWEAIERAGACDLAGAEIENVWNDDIRASLEHAFAATGLHYATIAADKVMPWLDRHAQAWSLARAEACRKATIHGTWDRDTFDRASWCLDDRRMEMEALVVELGRADKTVVQQAVTAAANLGMISPCMDQSLLQRQPPTPEGGRESSHDTRVQLAQAYSLELAGKFEEGLLAVADAQDLADELGWSPLVAAAQYREGVLRSKLGAHQQSEAALVDAYFIASRASAWDIAAAAAAHLVLTVGYHQARYPEGRIWARLAATAAAHAGEAGGLVEAQALGALAAVEWSTGAFLASESTNRRAIEITKALLGPSHPDLAGLTDLSGMIRYSLGHYGESRALHENAVMIGEEALGPHHPGIATSLIDLAVTCVALGLNDKARALAERALAIQEESFGPAHPNCAVSRKILADTYAVTGDTTQARVQYQRAIDIWGQALGPYHPELAWGLGSLGRLHLAVDEPREALALLARAVEIYDLREGEQEDEYLARFGLARALLQTGGNLARAVEEAEKALAYLRTIGEGRAGERAEIEAWLAELGDVDDTARHPGVR